MIRSQQRYISAWLTAIPFPPFGLAGGGLSDAADDLMIGKMG
jgi:hypothetical protein